MAEQQPSVRRPMTIRQLNAEAKARFVTFSCDEHGPLVDTFPTASVLCRCGKLAKQKLERRAKTTKTTALPA